MSEFKCKNIGHTSNGVTIEEFTDCKGRQAYRAYVFVQNIFGCDVNGPCLEGIGLTKEQALERLEQKKSDFNDSLWI